MRNFNLGNNNNKKAKNPIAKRELDRISFLQANAQPRDLIRFKETMISQTCGFGGLRSQVNLATMCLQKKVFEGKSNEDIYRFLFILGLKRETISEAMERLGYHEDLFYEYVLNRVKEESANYRNVTNKKKKPDSITPLESLEEKSNNENGDHVRMSETFE